MCFGVFWCVCGGKEEPQSQRGTRCTTTEESMIVPSGHIAGVTSCHYTLYDYFSSSSHSLHQQRNRLYYYCYHKHFFYFPSTSLGFDILRHHLDRPRIFYWGLFAAEHCTDKAEASPPPARKTHTREQDVGHRGILLQLHELNQNYEFITFILHPASHAAHRCALLSPHS